MSSSVTGTTITLTRGDTFKRTLVLTRNGEPYTPQQGDSIRFAMKRRYADSECLILKDIPTSTMIFHLEPSDTEGLAFGKYVYDIQMTYANGDVDTFIDKATFVITEEVE